jgi:hypothetical protein
MDESEWTEKRKSLCQEFWDNCAQEKPYCANSLGLPCDMILEAEKERLTVKELKLKLYKRYGIGKGSCASGRKTKAIAEYLGISTRLLSRILNKTEYFGEMHKKILDLCSDDYYFDYSSDRIVKRNA